MKCTSGDYCYDLKTERCSNRKRRKREIRRKIDEIDETYFNIYPNHLEKHAIEFFFKYDQDKDGKITLPEAEHFNISKVAFLSQDLNHDMVIHPYELDRSLNI